MPFSVDNGAHFRLDNIPRGLIENNTEWIEYLALDGRGWRCLKPSTPRQLVADLHPNLRLSTEGLELYDELKPKMIKSGEWMHDASASGLGLRTMAVMIFRTLLNQYYGRLSDVYQYPPGHPKFRGPAEFLLRAAAPGFLTLSFDETISSSSPVPDVDSTSTSESGSIYYWFRGCLVRLSTRLDSDTYLRSAVGDAVLRVRRSSLDTCTVLLWSMQHVAVVRVQGHQVTHSTAIPILAAYGTDDSALDCGIRLLTYYLRPALTSFHGDVRSRKRVPRRSEMEHLAELAEGLNVKDRRAPGPSVPFDVVAEIMSYADTPTYNTFSRVSRASRVLWARRPRLGPYTILFVPPQLPSAVNDTRRSNTSTSTGRFAAHDQSGLPIRFRLSYHGRYPDDDKETYTTRAARPENAKPLVLGLSHGVRCSALMADLVNDVRHAIYITEEVDRERDDESGNEDN